MTTKDFVSIANIVAAEANKPGTDSEVGERRIVCHNIASNLADLAKQSNPRFDRDRFMNACGFAKVSK